MNASAHSYPPRPDDIPDNAIAKAALEIRKLHEQQIDMIDNGHAFVAKQPDGSMKNVSQKMKQASLDEIAICDGIIKRSPHMSRDVMKRGATLHLQIVEEIDKVVNAPANEQLGTVKADELPEGLSDFKH